jgi:HPt (histidine-containing phosphotransfer) domain-containing protein
LFAKIYELSKQHFSNTQLPKGITILSGPILSTFDAKFAINQFSGNQPLLVKILGKFIQQYQQFDIVIAEQLQQDFQAAKKQVHTVKGVSGNLGMMALHNACRQLEVSFASKTTEYSLEEFLQVFKQTLTSVQNYSAENGVEETTDLAPQQVEKTQLIAALKRNEFISESKISTYTQSLNLSSGKLDELKRAIHNLDYPVAIELLE